MAAFPPPLPFKTSALLICSNINQLFRVHFWHETNLFDFILEMKKSAVEKQYLYICVVKVNTCFSLQIELETKSTKKIPANLSLFSHPETDISAKIVFIWS